MDGQPAPEALLAFLVISFNEHLATISPNLEGRRCCEFMTLEKISMSGKLSAGCAKVLRAERILIFDFQNLEVHPVPLDLQILQLSECVQRQKMMSSQEKDNLLSLTLMDLIKQQQDSAPEEWGWTRDSSQAMMDQGAQATSRACHAGRKYTQHNLHKYVTAARDGLLKLRAGGSTYCIDELPESEIGDVDQLEKSLWVSSFDKSLSGIQRKVFGHLASALKSCNASNKASGSKSAHGQDRRRESMIRRHHYGFIIARMIVDRLTPHVGSRSILLLEALAARDFHTGIDYLPKRVHEAFAEEVVHMLKTDKCFMQLPSSTLVLHPAVFVAKAKGMSYREACQQTGLGQLGELGCSLTVFSSPWIPLSCLGASESWNGDVIMSDNLPYGCTQRQHWVTANAEVGHQTLHPQANNLFEPTPPIGQNMVSDQLPHTVLYVASEDRTKVNCVDSFFNEADSTIENQDALPSHYFWEMASFSGSQIYSYGDGGEALRQTSAEVDRRIDDFDSKFHELVEDDRDDTTNCLY